MLIQWKNLPPFEATWEDFELLNSQFPTFHIEDKVHAWGIVLISHKFISSMLKERACEPRSFNSNLVFSLAGCFRGLFEFSIFFY